MIVAAMHNKLKRQVRLHEDEVTSCILAHCNIIQQIKF